MIERKSENQMYMDFFIKHLNDPTLKHDVYESTINIRKYHQWCLDNKRLCQQLMSENIKNKFNIDIYNQFGLPDNFCLSSISDNVRRSKYDEQGIPMPFSQKTLEEMLACEKYPLTPHIYRAVTKDEIYCKSKKHPDSVYGSVSTWYFGKVLGQPTLFKEIVNYPITGKIMVATKSSVGFPNAGGSYELKAIIGGKSELVMELLRGDYNPIAPHPNYINTKTGELYREPENIYGTHVHQANELFNVVYPNCSNSPDAIPMYIDRPRMTFGQMVCAIRDSANILDKNPVFNSEFEGSSVVAKTRDLSLGKKLIGTFESRLTINTVKYKTEPYYSETKKIPCDKIAKYDFDKDVEHDLESEI